eukprot:CAMPEP_0185833524 /NCGR_PEP_ID=MMETSP1353-20130828/3017_1 /TAXON_ID=1077150 /ORGANISM="Erythrolobus australicus, Strain CCMP3124" /LENGTH=102 /DNA_ID=CAMNT_0028531827 /DNA_START=364 /DNA_END=672 /DNA_ORIENTATION=+
MKNQRRAHGTAGIVEHPLRIRQDVLAVPLSKKLNHHRNRFVRAPGVGLLVKWSVRRVQQRLLKILRGALDRFDCDALHLFRIEYRRGKLLHRAEQRERYCTG